MKSKSVVKVVLVVLAVVLVAYGIQGYAQAASNPDDILKERLKGAVAVYSGSMYALVDNKLKVIDPADELITPFFQNGRILVPVRFIAEAFGAGVTWNQASQTATVTQGGKGIKIKLYSSKMTANNKSLSLDVPAMLTGKRIFLPLRAVGEALGKKVFYNQGLVVLSPKEKVFDVEREKALLTKVAGKINILPKVGSQEKLLKLLANMGSANNYGDIRTMKKELVLNAPSAQTSTQTMDQKAATVSNITDYSKTNVQVAGVDEGDIVKTDGEYIYQVSNGKILIFKAFPTDKMELVSSISFDEGKFSPLELYIQKDKLVIIGTAFYNSPISLPQPGGLQKIPAIYPGYGETKTTAVIYDVSDRSKPIKEREVSLEGSYLTSRIIGSNLYLIGNKNIYDLQGANPKLNPVYSDSALGTKEITIPYDKIRYIPPVVNRSYLLVAGLSLEDTKKPMSVETFLGAGEEVYVSQDNLYVTVNEGFRGIRPMLFAAKRFMPPLEQEATLVYKFSLKNGNIAYEAKGQIPGRILNQFSMDEQDEYFRVATTVGNGWMPNADGLSNSLYVLDSNLNTVGKLEKLASGEKIYSVRFMGDRAYVVTFKTVDPLFVIDLQKPEKPTVLGTLKIPGYSDYLHPYDENHLIGFGKNTMTVPVKDGSGNSISNTAFYLGMKVSIFDVSDVTHPREKFAVTIGDRGTDSELLRDHKALLIDKEKQILAFPVNEAKINGPVVDPVSGYPNYGQIVFNGAYVYKLNLQDGFTLKGKITHMTSEDYLKSGYDMVDYAKQIKRMLYIDNVLYGVSDSKLSAHSMDTIKELKSVNQ